MTLVLWVLLAHLLYDFHWQGDFIARMKGESGFILFVHALTWTLCIAGAMHLCGHPALPWMMGFLLATHFIVDGWKARLPKTPEWFWAIYVDQALHFATIVVVTVL